MCAKLLVLVLFASVLQLNGLVRFESAAYAQPEFSDIDTSYAKSEIEALVQAGIISGYEDGTFAPANPITRAELAKIVTAMLGLQPKPEQAEHFADVAEDSWYRGYIGALVEAGITQGTSETAFSPEANVTREEMIVFFIRAFGLEKTALAWKSDVKWSDAGQISGWAKAYVDFGYRIGFVRGIANADGSLRFDPRERAERQAVARLAFEFVSKLKTYLEQAEAIIKNGANPSATPATSVSPASTSSSAPSPTPASTATPSPTGTPDATTSPAPSSTPDSTATPTPTGSPGATTSPAPSSTPASTATPTPSGSPDATSSPTAGPTSEPTSTPSASPLSIVQNGQAHASIVVAADADAQILAAANTLAEYVQKSTGAQLPVVTEDQLSGDNGQARIHIGANASQPDSHLDELLQDVDADGDGYVIHFHGDEIVIAGSSVWGTKNGVFAFLERYVGVRWLMPGPDGEDVPQTTDLTIEGPDILENPAFMQRVVSPMVTSPDEAHPWQLQNEWAQRNRLQGKYNMPVGFHHNVYSLFPPEKYGQSNPEFYPLRNGVRYIPPADSTTYWQPCYSEPGTIQAAVNGIIEFFTNNPDADSFSLGVNDGRGYCETEPGHSQYPEELNSVGLPDMSDIYYGWVNAVAEGVLAVFPDKWFGLLAYDNVMDPPSFKLNPRVIPFITQDRMAWIDSEVESVAKQKLAEWSEAADNIGWYDYLYGNPYLIPRMYTKQMAENYIYAENHGVLAHYAELYTNWGEGPKPWIAAKLQWNPNQDIDALLDEWYERAVGEAASADLRAYYDYWETFWVERIPNSEWFESSKNATYLEFTDPGYMDLVTPQDIAYSRSLLESVLAKAVTDKQKARASLLLRAFEYYEASALSYPKKVGPIADESTALSLLNGVAIEESIAMAQKRIDLIDEFKNDPVLEHNLDISRFPLLNWSGWNVNEFWELADYMRLHEPGGGAVTQSVYGLSQVAENTKNRQYARLLQEAGLNKFPLNGNASFEDTVGIAPWGTWIDKPPATIARTTEISRPGGTASLLVSNLTKGGPIQTFDVKPGLMASQVHFYTPPGTQTKAIIRLSFNFMDKDGKVLKNAITPAKFVSQTVGQWSSVRVLDDIPAFVNGVEVKKVQMIVYINDVEAATKLYLDDVTFFQSNEDFVTSQSFWSIFDYVKANEAGSEAMRNKLQIAAQKDEATDGREYARLLLSMLDGSQPVNNDPSFELGAGSGPGSTVTYWSQFGAMQRVTDASNVRTGNAGILLAGPAAQRLTAQYFTFKPGATAVRVYYKLPAGATSSGTIQLRMNLNTSSGTAVTVIGSKVSQLSASQGDWAAIDFAFMLPATFNNLEVGKAQFVVVTNGMETANTIYLDDANVYQ